MKMIVAMIQPFKLNDVVLRLEGIKRFPGLTVTECRGFGREKTKPHEMTAAEAATDFTKKVRLEIAAPDELSGPITDAIAEGAHTGLRGDGWVFVWTLDNAVHIRTLKTSAP
jgi:nitrogen regulatory protein PII